MKRLAEVVPDMVLLDLHLPEVSGGLFFDDFSGFSFLPSEEDPELESFDWDVV